MKAYFHVFHLMSDVFHLVSERINYDDVRGMYVITIVGNYCWVLQIY